MGIQVERIEVTVEGDLDCGAWGFKKRRSVSERSRILRH
jgi:hypothetical protein